MNPKLLQSGPPGQVPLLLIHDGGGTCAHYCSLPRLGRPVWAIHHPRRAAKDSWKGGLADMARVYIELVRTAIPRGPLLVGGWSLGGIVALEMAVQLALAPQSDLTVLGVVLIDSVFPIRAPDTDAVWQSPPVCPARVPLHVKREIRLCMAMSVDLLDRWTPSPLGLSKPPQDYFNLACSAASPLNDYFTQPAHPTAVLLRAVEPVPVPENEKKGDTTVSRVDVHRNKLLLGWESYPQNFIQTVIHVPGHHFSIFDSENIPSLGEHLDQACRILDQA